MERDRTGKGREQAAATANRIAPVFARTRAPAKTAAAGAQTARGAETDARRNNFRRRGILLF